MADFDFRVTAGPYEGRYEIDLADLTASEAGAFRKAVGLSLADVVTEGGGDIDSAAALVWLVRRRNTKGLPYQMVADAITYGMVGPGDTEDGEAEAGSVDPTTLPPSDGG